jgi:hypothetical protein
MIASPPPRAPQITSFEPHARPPDSFRKPRQGDPILFNQTSSVRNEGRLEAKIVFFTFLSPPLVR